MKDLLSLFVGRCGFARTRLLQEDAAALGLWALTKRRSRIAFWLFWGGPFACLSHRRRVFLTLCGMHMYMFHGEAPFRSLIALLLAVNACCMLFL